MPSQGRWCAGRGHAQRDGVRQREHGFFASTRVVGLLTGDSFLSRPSLPQQEKEATTLSALEALAQIEG